MNRVFVYWNLHKGCWSVRDQKTRQVLGHADALVLTDCTFKVSEAGRQRVLRERCKNVHAGVVGTIVDVEELAYTPQPQEREAYYNPYKTATFISGTTPLHIAAVVRLTADRRVFFS